MLVHILQYDVLVILLVTNCFCCSGLAIRGWLAVPVETDSKRSTQRRRLPGPRLALCHQPHGEDGQRPDPSCLGCHAEGWWEGVGFDLVKSRFGRLQEAQVA